MISLEHIQHLPERVPIQDSTFIETTGSKLEDDDKLDVLANCLEAHIPPTTEADAGRGLTVFTEGGDALEVDVHTLLYVNARITKLSKDIPKNSVPGGLRENTRTHCPMCLDS
ncbi:hypothetical protein R1flu_014586 [Riccia fluitans]|uniref:Uncharacterized protein n=1 Tax=Riccia fluitans TaxID=41844 RepID=A0ABD1YGV4_9MARC